MNSTSSSPLSIATKDGWVKIEPKTMISHLKDHAIIIQRRDGQYWFKSIPADQMGCPMEGDITVVGEEYL